VAEGALCEADGSSLPPHLEASQARQRQPQTDLGWKVVNAASVAVAAIVTQRLLSKAWRLVRHQPPPSGPADRKVTWGAALIWAASMAVGIAVSRVVAVRLSGNVWEAAVHEPPPESPS
jgi:hypothetical protein